jgi:DNA (cytosine-5)-methyltransferase 1
MNHLGLFEGIGGFSLAARWMGWHTKAWVEINPFCQKVLKKNFPEVQGYADIKEFDGTKYRGTIDIITGGFPCQPFSIAGKRKGKEDDRYLWPEMLRVIREVRPSFIVGENVTGIIGMALEQVLTSLEAEEYNTETFIIPACAVNAPHRRDRLWIIAYTNYNGSHGAENGQGNIEGNYNNTTWENPIKQSKGYSNKTARKVITNTKIKRLSEWNAESFQHKTHSTTERYTCIPGWKNFPTKPGVCGRNDGIPNRVDRLKGLGNAIVPQVALQIFKSIDSIASC